MIPDKIQLLHYVQENETRRRLLELVWDMDYMRLMELDRVIQENCLDREPLTAPPPPPQEYELKVSEDIVKAAAKFNHDLAQQMVDIPSDYLDTINENFDELMMTDNGIGK